MNEKDLIKQIFILKDYFQKEYEQRREIEINSKSPYSNEINKYIRNAKELEIYKSCQLIETEITRKTLIFPIDIDFEYVSGTSNLQLMLRGECPYDKSTRQKIELHHIGQKFNSPFAELPRLTHCSTETYSILHNTCIESWRIDSKLIVLTQKETIEYWKTRGEILAKKDGL